MNKGKSATSDGGLVIGSSVGYTCSGQLLPSTAIVTSAKLSAIHVTSKSNGDRVAKASHAPTPASPSSHQPALSSTGNTASPNTNASNATSKGPFEDVNFRIKYVDKETKSKNRSTISKFMEYSSFVSSPHFSESMKKHLLLNGNAQPFLNHDACAAQVRTIMKAAGLTPEKMTLMAELFASEEEDGDDEAIFEDEIEDHLNMVSNSHHLDSEDVEYEEEEEEEDDDEDVPGDGGDEGDDEEEDDMSEIDSFTLEDDTLNSKFLMSVDSSDNPHASGRLYKNDIELHFSNIPESLTASATNVAVEHFTDSQLYHELQFASSDVHHVLDEVGATIAKMRISDTNLMPYLVHKLQEEVLHHSNARAANPSTQYANKMSSESRNLKPSVVQHCHLSGLAPFNLAQHVSEEDANASDDILEDGVIHDAALLEETAEKTVQFSLDELQRKDSDKLLLYAAASGHFDMVKLLLSTQKINIDKRGVKEMTPLMEAASGGFLDIVRLLIDHGADVNCKTQQGNSALMYSCAMGHLEVVKELISHGASIEDQNENGHTALMEAASAGHAEVARFLVSQGCNINVHSNEYKETALTLAAYKGHFEMVRFLINAGAGQEHRAEEMHTALMEASMDGHVEVARLLIDSGAQVNMPPDSFESPLTLAACGGHVELALLLLERGANIEEVNDEGYTALMEAAREGHEEMVALLISHKAKVNATTEESKETALFMACGAGCVEVVNLLIKAGADIELGTSTPLMEASQEGHIEIVKRLLDAKAKVNATNSAGETALNLAAENGHTGVINLLIAAGAEVDHCVEGGKTALMKAAQMGHHDAVLQLVNAKADVNRTTSNNEQTALSMACSGGHVQVVEVLLQAGADLFHRLKDNSTMLIEAAKGGHTSVVQVLIDYHHYKTNGGVHPTHPTFLDNTQAQAKVTVPGVRPPDAPTPTKAPQPVNMDFDQEESLAALREKLSSMGIQDTYPTMPPEVPTFLAAADSTMQLAASVSSFSPCATTPLTTSQSQSTAGTPLASSCSAPFTNLQTNVSQPIVSYSNELNFNFASKLYKKESEPGTTNNTSNNTTTTTSTTSQANASTVTLTTASPKDPDVFKRIRSSKSAPTSKSTPLSLPPMAATVSINTNTTSTATTAVCVGTLLPQGNGQTTETTSFSQSTVPPNPAPTTAAPLAAPKITSFTATTKSITKVKNAIGSQAKALVADASTGTISSSPTCTHGQTRPGAAVIPPQAAAAPAAAAPSPTAAAAASGQQPKSSKAAGAPSIDLNSQTDSNHDTALTLACAGGHEDLVKLLLARGADIEHREKKGLSPLMLAATNGHAKIVDILFSHGADLEAQTERTKDTALSLACSSGRYEVVENLLSRGANKEHRNVSDYTPLSLAASGGYVTIINLLLSYGAEINSRTGSKLGISPLMLAAMNGHTDTTRLLLDRGSDINAYIETNRNTALTLACFQGRTEVVGLLLDRNANIEHRAKTGLTPLMEAASGGYVDVGRVLLDKGADVNAPPVPASRDTALTIAADKGHALFVELLILGGAMVDVKNKKGYSPLWLACNGGHFEVATILVNAKCDVDSQDNRKISCLMASFKRGHVKIVKFLVKHVSQFPSDQEISRCLALCTEEELNKKASLCADILHQAKERQAAEAYKNAANLLEEIDQERNRDESRKAAAARRRERRKQKKKAERPDNEDDDVDDDDDKFEESPDSKSADKLMKDDESKEDEAPKPKKKKKKKKSKKSALASAETVPAGDDDDDEDTTAVTIDDDDFDCYDELPEEYPEDVPIMNLIADMVSKAELKKKLKKKANKSKAPDTSKAAEPMAPPAAPARVPEPTPVVPVAKVSEPAEILTVNATQPGQPDKKNVKKNSKTQAKAKESQPPVPVTEKPKDVSEVTKPKSVDLPVPSQTFKNKNVEEPAEKVNPIIEATKVADSKAIVTDYSDLDDDSSWNEPTFIVKSYSRHGKNRKGETGLANSGNSNQPSSAPGMGKREEGWKEVVRKSKKVVVPANAISRVIGRGGCNINTIREVSGAHIEVEKQKGQGDRMVIIRGSADATRHAHQLITVLSKETEKELTEIIRELGLDMLSQSVPPVASSTAPSSTASATSVTSSAASVDEAPLASTLVLDSAESSQSGASGQIDISSTASNSRSLKSKAMQSVLGSKTTNVATISTATASSALVYTSSSSSLHSKNSKSPSSASNDSNWTYGSTGKAAPQPVSASSTCSVTASYTMAINSKTRSTTTTTTSSSKSSNGVKIMSAVYKPSNKSQIHTNSSYASSRNHHSSSKSTDSNHGEALPKGSVSPSNVSKSTPSGFEANNKLISEPTIPSSFSSLPESMPMASTVEPSDSEYTPFNSLYSGNSLWTNCKTTGKANVQPAGSINSSAPAAPIAAIGSGFTQKQLVEISVDESKAPGFNRQQFVSPGSFSTSSTSSFSSASAMPPLNISTNTASMPQHMLGPIGPVRSAPCTPPISSATASNQFGRTSKFAPGQPPQPLGLVDLYGNPLNMVDTISAIAAPKSQILDSFMTNVSADIMKPPTDFATSLQQSAQSNLFPSMNPEDKFSGSSQSMFNNARQMNFLDINSSSSLYGHAAMANANANRASSLNPNAPDFPSRSNSFSANPLSHPSLMSHANSTNSLNGSNSSIASGAGFSNLAGAPSRPGYPGMQVNAPPISNTAVRAAIVNYSMNLFQNQVPKQHQEAAARLAHLSAQNPNFANNEFQNVFIGNGSANSGGANSSVNVNAPNTNGTMHSAAVGSRESAQQQQVPDKVRLLQYMYQQQGQFKPSSSMSGVTNTSTFAQSQNAFNANNFGQQTQFGGNALARGPLPSSLNSAAFSTANLESSLTSSLFASSGMNNIANTNAELSDDCLQRMKAPAPIGTERAQRKMPMHAFGPVSQGPASLSANQHAIGIPNANSLNSNSLFADQSFGNTWNMGNSADSMNTPAESIFSNSHSGLTSSFNADYSDLFLSNNLSELNQLDPYSTMMNQRQQPMQASAIPGQKFNSMNLMDGLTFESSSQMPSNTFKGLNNTGNSLFPNANPPFVGGTAPTANIDSDYWSSSSSSSIAKQTPNCSTSGMNAAFDNKLGWNNWNS